MEQEKNSKINLDISGWAAFNVSEIFKITSGSGITLEEIENNPGSVSAIQSGETNGGVLGYIDEEYCKAKKYHIVQGPFLSVARSGTSGYVAYHPGKCVIGDSVKALVLKEKSTENVYLFLQTVLQQNRYKYSYGRKVTLDNYSSLVIKLPVLKDHEGNVIIDRKKKFSKNGYIPDWGYMESYVNSIILREREWTSSFKSVANVCRAAPDDCR